MISSFLWMFPPLLWSISAVCDMSFSLVQFSVQPNWGLINAIYTMHTGYKKHINMTINIALNPWKSKYNEKWEKFAVKIDVHRFLQYFLWSLHMCWLLARKCHSVLRMAKFMETVTESDLKKKKRTENWKCNLHAQIFLGQCYFSIIYYCI